jgi:hypothetical protein
VALRAFEQDPDAPPGAGLFHFDDGPSVYAHDPDAAASVSLPALPDGRLATNWDPISAGGQYRGAGDPSSSPATDPILAGGQYSAPPPSIADVGPNVSEPPPEYYQSERPAPVASMAPMVSEAPTAPTANAPQPALAAPRVPQAPPRFLYSRGSPGGDVLPTGQTVERTGGMPVTEQEMADRWGMFEDRMRAKQAALGALSAKQEFYQEQAAHRQEEFLRAYHDAARERDEVASRKVDPDRYFKDRGIVANIGMAIAQGMMVYGASITHVQNPAMQWVQNAIDRDVAAQQEDYRREGLRAQNKLTEIMQKYQVDSERAGAVLKNLQGQVAGLVGSDYAQASGSAEMKTAWDAYLADETAKLNDSNVRLLRDAYGQQKQVTTARVTQPTAGGVVENPVYARDRKARREDAELRKLENSAGGYMGTIYPDEGSYREAAINAIATGKAPDVETFTRSAQLKGGGGGGGDRISPRLAGAVVK